MYAQADTDLHADLLDDLERWKRAHGLYDQAAALQSVARALREGQLSVRRYCTVAAWLRLFGGRELSV